MATRRNTAAAQDQLRPSNGDRTELLPELREYRTSDLRPPSTPASVQPMLSLARAVAEIEDTLAEPSQLLQ